MTSGKTHLTDDEVMALLAKALRDRLARGESVHPMLQDVMDGLRPGWRDDE